MNHAKTVLLGAGVLLLLGAGARADTQFICAITESVEWPQPAMLTGE